MYVYSCGSLSSSAPFARSHSGPLVDCGARYDLDREMVQADAVAVVLARPALRLTQADRRVAAAQVPDRLAALAFDLADPVPPEGAEQLSVERQAALDGGDDEVDVMDSHPIQRGFDARRTSPPYHPRACISSTTTW